MRALATPRTCRPRRSPRGTWASAKSGGVARAAAAVPALDEKLVSPGAANQALTVVYKFGGSSVRDAERMKEVAKIVCAFPEHKPAVVLSAMGKSTNLLLGAGEAAMHCNSTEVPDLPQLKELRQLHMDTVAELRCDEETVEEVEELLMKLQQLLTGISLMEELTARTSDNLVSFGERLSTRIFASYLRAEGVNSLQYDSFDSGFVTTDDFMNGEILPETYDLVGDCLGGNKDHIPIVTGFLARGVESHAVTTLGRGGSDLSATVIARSLGLEEAQVWKDVDGVLTTDPRMVPEAVPVPELTYDEAMELAYFGAQVLHPQAMRPAIDYEGEMTVRVKNSYNISAPGTVIKRKKEKAELLTSIVLKKNVTMLDIQSTRMLGQYGFLSRVFEVMARNGISVDVVATSEVSVSLTLDPAKIWSRDLVPQEIESLLKDLSAERIARVKVTTGHSIISLICNAKGQSSQLLERVFSAFMRKNINVQMISQGASKTNIQMLVSSEEGEEAVKAIHNEFFE